MSDHSTLARRAWLAAAVVALAAGAAAAAPAYAAPAPASVHVLHCPSLPRPATCHATVPVTAPETVRVTVDKPGVSTVIYRWTITNARGVVRCSGSYRPADPIRAWLCSLTSGRYTFSTPASDGPTLITLTY